MSTFPIRIYLSLFLLASVSWSGAFWSGQSRLYRKESSHLRIEKGRRLSARKGDCGLLEIVSISRARWCESLFSTCFIFYYSPFYL
jgi:hypothetical protein